MESRCRMSPYNPNYFRKGLLPLILLRLLKEKDMYGYELIKTIAERTDGILAVKEGAMYPVLYQMLEAGQVTEYRVPHKKRMTHIYYHLEPAGEAQLEELIREYRSVTGAMMRLLGLPDKGPALVSPDNAAVPKED